jgi:hypothetical protein
LEIKHILQLQTSSQTIFYNVRYPKELYYSRDGSDNINPDEINISGGTNTTKLIENPASGIVVNQSESSATGKSWVGYGWQDGYDLAEINPKTVFEN